MSYADSIYQTDIHPQRDAVHAEKSGRHTARARLDLPAFSPGPLPPRLSTYLHRDTYSARESEREKRGTSACCFSWRGGRVSFLRACSVSSQESLSCSCPAERPPLVFLPRTFLSLQATRIELQCPLKRFDSPAEQRELLLPLLLLVSMRRRREDRGMPGRDFL